MVDEHALLVEDYYAGVNSNAICFGCTTHIEALSPLLIDHLLSTYSLTLPNSPLLFKY